MPRKSFYSGHLQMHTFESGGDGTIMAITPTFKKHANVGPRCQMNLGIYVSMSCRKMYSMYFVFY